MSINSESDLAGLRKVGQIVARCLQYMQTKLEPGMTTAELDQIGGQFLTEYGAQSAPKLAYGFPGYTCISVNEEAAHGIPGPRVLQAGDLINIDVSAELDGYFADTGGSSIIPPEAKRAGFNVIENIGSHGVGRALHEEPGFIAGYYEASDPRILSENQVITIEPFISSGARQVFDKGDGWTLVTKAGTFTAQYEHTLVITKGRALIMTLPN